MVGRKVWRPMKKRKITEIYDRALSYENIYSVWKIVRKTCKNRRAVYRFSLNKSTNIYTILKTLEKRTYRPMPY